MRAAICETLEGPGALVIRHIDRPKCAQGQVRIRVRAAGVNFPDLLMTEGGYQLKPPLPFIPGMEIAGEVLESDAADVPVGARVIAGLRFGGFAEEVAVPARAVHPMPDALDFAEGACLMVAASTAYHALVDRGRLAAGQILVVHGATGGVGMAAVDLARHLGARVIATGGDMAKLDALAARGADAVVATPGEDFPHRLADAVGPDGADLVFDAVGGDLFDASLPLLRPGGAVLVVGFAAGRIPAVTGDLVQAREIAVIGLRAGEAARRDPARGARNAGAILDLVSRGVMRPLVCARLPLEAAGRALAMLRERKVLGRIALIP